MGEPDSFVKSPGYIPKEHMEVRANALNGEFLAV